MKTSIITVLTYDITEATYVTIEKRKLMASQMQIMSYLNPLIQQCMTTQYKFDEINILYSHLFGMN